MKRPYDYLEMYRNSPETEQLLEPYSNILNDAQKHVARVQKAVCINTADAADLKCWLTLFNPPECIKLTDRERICDSECFFLGAPAWRIKEIVSRAAGCSINDVFVIENECCVNIALPEKADFVPGVYIKYLENIKPAHVLLNVYRRRTHAELAVCTHEQLSQYTHAGFKKEEN